jgi:3-oxoacyl-[acyl-carrier protein] reductase
MGDNAGIDDLAHAKTPLGRNSSTQEIVDLIEYLIGDRSSFINGAVINIDGGYTIIDTVVKEEFERHSEEK